MEDLVLTISHSQGFHVNAILLILDSSVSQVSNGENAKQNVPFCKSVVLKQLFSYTKLTKKFSFQTNDQLNNMLQISTFLSSTLAPT